MLYRRMIINGNEYPLAVNQQGSGKPDTETPGAVGVLYMDTDDGSLYKCTAAGNDSCTWEKVSSAEPSGEEDGIPGYWEAHLTKKIAAIKNLQRSGGKDCYSFVVIADYHRYSNLGKRSPVLIKKVMDECGIRFCLCLGDIQSGGAWKTKAQELAEWEEIENEFAPIRDRTLMIPGNHDGAYGSEDINGDGVIHGVTDYYIYNLTPDEMYDLIYRKVSLINGATFSGDCNGYYVDDTAAKVRYIMVNTHYSDGVVNENGTAVNNYMRKMRIGQSQHNMVMEALKNIPGEDWHVVIGSHMPLTVFRGEGGGGDLQVLCEVLTAYQNRTVCCGTFGTEGTYDYVSVDVDFSDAKGSVIGAFAGHLHEDLSSSEYVFPIITTASDNTVTFKIDGVVSAGEVGTVTEQSFDVFTVNKRTGVIHATKIGYGENRVFGDSGADVPDTPAVSYTNLADPTSADWLENSAYNSGVIEEWDRDYRTTNYIPVTQYDILRWKGLDMENSATGAPILVLYDESKTFLTALSLLDGGNNSIFPVMTTDENGVTSYEILMRGDTGQQFVYNDYCTKVKYVRFRCHNGTPVDDIIITVNEEIA